VISTTIYDTGLTIVGASPTPTPQPNLNQKVFLPLIIRGE
jgi:hypothetical protein